jgi:hypothetical protein
MITCTRQPSNVATAGGEDAGVRGKDPGQAGSEADKENGGAHAVPLIRPSLL